MKINAVITKKPRIMARNEKLDMFDRSLLLIFAFMLISILAGAIIYRIKSNLFSSAVFESFVAFSTDVTGKSFFEAFSGFFAADLSVLIIITLLGVSAFGRIPILAAAVFRVLGIGALGAYLFDKFASAGLKYFLTVLLPGRVFMFFALLLSVQNCFQTGRKARLILTGKSTETIDFKIYLLRNTVAAVVFAAAAMTDTLLLRFVSGHFLPEL
ncbi:MAG: stage II sporulation protein M [Clostridiaceae bacterium]|nr:stage II sporulation protein M [Clostridiaceae bacterium]MDY5992059.1 stage II sporulation protein M [Oscillospiraceae bacterium]